MNGRRFARCSVLLGAALLAACATVPRSGALQSIELEAVTPMGAAIAGVSCTLDSPLGSWQATAPGRVTVAGGPGALVVRCQAGGGQQKGEATVASRVVGGSGTRALGGAAIGGMVGAVAGSRGGRSSEPGGFDFSGVTMMVGGLLGALLGGGAGAATADPRHEYPEHVRIVLQAVAADPPR